MSSLCFWSKSIMTWVVWLGAFTSWLGAQGRIFPSTLSEQRSKVANRRRNAWRKRISEVRGCGSLCPMSAKNMYRNEKYQKWIKASKQQRHLGDLGLNLLHCFSAEFHNFTLIFFYVLNRMRCPTDRHDARVFFFFIVYFLKKKSRYRCWRSSHSPAAMLARPWHQRTLFDKVPHALIPMVKLRNFEA